MTLDNVIRIGYEAGLCDEEGRDDNSIFIDEHMTRFAKLVIKAERNRLADELQKMPLNDTANSIAIWIRGQE